jgi:hypothetical protein
LRGRQADPFSKLLACQSPVALERLQDQPICVIETHVGAEGAAPYALARIVEG